MTLTRQGDSPEARTTQRYAYHDYRRWAAALRTDAAGFQHLAECIVTDAERHGPLAQTLRNRKAAMYEQLAGTFLDASEQYESIAADLRLHLTGERL